MGSKAYNFRCPRPWISFSCRAPLRILHGISLRSYNFQCFSDCSSSWLKMPLESSILVWFEGVLLGSKVADPRHVLVLSKNHQILEGEWKLWKSSKFGHCESKKCVLKDISETQLRELSSVNTSVGRQSVSQSINGSVGHSLSHSVTQSLRSQSFSHWCTQPTLSGSQSLIIRLQLKSALDKSLRGIKLFHESVNQ